MSFFSSLSPFPVVPLRTPSYRRPHHHHSRDKKDLLFTMSSLSRPVVSPECFYGVLINRVFLIAAVNMFLSIWWTYRNTSIVSSGCYTLGVLF